MFRFKGTIIRPKMRTQSWYSRALHTLWDPILFTIVLTLKYLYKLLANVFKMSIRNKLRQEFITYRQIHIYILNKSANSLYMKFNVNTIVNNMGYHSVCTLRMYQDCILIFGLMMVLCIEKFRRIFNIDHYIYCCVTDWNKLLYQSYANLPLTSVLF